MFSRIRPTINPEILRLHIRVKQIPLISLNRIDIFQKQRPKILHVHRQRL